MSAISYFLFFSFTSPPFSRLRFTDQKRGTLFGCPALSVHCRHEGSQFFFIFGSNRWFLFYLIIVEVERKPSLRSLILFVAAHCEGGTIRLQTLKLVLQYVAPTIAANDEHNFAVAHLVKKLMAVTSYLAYDRLERLVGCWTFFESSGFSSVSLTGTTSGMLYQLFRSLATDSSNSLISCGVAS